MGMSTPDPDAGLATPDNPYADDPRLHAPSGRSGRAEKTVAPAGPGATSDEDAAAEAEAAEAAVDVIPADDAEALGDPDAASGTND